MLKVMVRTSCLLQKPTNTCSQGKRGKGAGTAGCNKRPIVGDDDYLQWTTTTTACPRRLSEPSSRQSERGSAAASRKVLQGSAFRFAGVRLAVAAARSAVADSDEFRRPGAQILPLLGPLDRRRETTRTRAHSAASLDRSESGTTGHVPESFRVSHEDGAGSLPQCGGR